MHLAPHSPAALQSISMSMRRAHARKTPRPEKCDECGKVIKRRSSLTWYRHSWICRSCLCPEIPDCVEAYALSGMTNFREGIEVWGEYGWGWGIESD